jgi:protein-disulfide isomerase
VSENYSGNGILLAAIIVSAAFIAGSYIISNALDRTTAQIEYAAEALGDLEVAGAPGPRPSRPARPDPSRDYKVEVGESPAKGPEDASVTIIEFSDFQCPFCNRVSPTLARIEQEYGDQVRIVFKHMPLSIHPQAPAAHAAAEAAHRQGKFWEMHDRIFENQRDLTEEAFTAYAEALDLDLERFARDASSDEVKKRIEDDLREASELGVSGTPSFFINGRFLSGAQPFDNFKRAIDSALEKKS